MNNQDELKVAGYYDSLSAVSRYIRMYYGQTPLPSGTCFFVMSADGPVLVTNRHNIAGESLHKECAIPDHAVVRFTTLSGAILNSMEPPVARYVRWMRLSRVDLPAPLPPITPTHCPDS